MPSSGPELPETPKVTRVTLGQRLTERLGRTPRGATALVRLFGLTKIPLLWFVRPEVLALDEDQCVIKIRLRRRTRNHLGAMYVGVLAAGADCAAGLLAMQRIRVSGRRVDLLFANMDAAFLKRVEADAVFSCRAGPAILAGVDETIRTGARVNIPVPVEITVPSVLGHAPAARFVMTLTLKRR